jgi:hypothetical protein
MAIIRATVGDKLKEFGETSDLVDVWEFVNQIMAASECENGIVLMDDSGATLGEIWDKSQYFAHWETVDKMRTYLYMVCFDQDR